MPFWSAHWAHSILDCSHFAVRASYALVLSNFAHLTASVNLNPYHHLGGNSIDKAPPGKFTDWVKANGGHTVITKVSAVPSTRVFTSATCR